MVLGFLGFTKAIHRSIQLNVFGILKQSQQEVHYLFSGFCWKRSQAQSGNIIYSWRRKMQHSMRGWTQCCERRRRRGLKKEATNETNCKRRMRDELHAVPSNSYKSHIQSRWFAVLSTHSQHSVGKMQFHGKRKEKKRKISKESKF